MDRPAPSRHHFGERNVIGNIARAADANLRSALCQAAPGWCTGAEQAEAALGGGADWNAPLSDVGQKHRFSLDAPRECASA